MLFYFIYVLSGNTIHIVVVVYKEILMVCTVVNNNIYLFSDIILDKYS